MKSLLLSLFLCIVSTAHLAAQGRLSISPTYWINYNPYSYRVDMNYSGYGVQTQVAGYTLVSSVGLTARYHITTKWDVLVGGLYTTNTNYRTRPENPYSDQAPFTSEGVQVPVLINYRLTSTRLSPYFSIGATFNNSRAFMDIAIRTDAVIGAGIDYRLNPNLSLLLQPTTGYPLYELTDNAYFLYSRYRSYNLGVQTQLIWRF